MIKIRWGVIAGTIAFILSFGVGILHDNNLFYVLTRAIVFMAVFFGLGMGTWLLISNFIPELLYADSGENGEGEVSRPGSRVNITLDNAREGALPEMYRNSDNPEEVGNITDLISGAVNPAVAAHTGGARSQEGMDHNREDGYTYKEGGGTADHGGHTEYREEAPQDDDVFPFKEGQGAAAVFSAGFGNGDGLGGLPDLDAMAGAFLTNAGKDADPPPESLAIPVTSVPAAPAEPSLPERKVSNNKAQPLQGDFNPKELAEGIRTVLSRET